MKLAWYVHDINTKSVYTGIIVIRSHVHINVHIPAYDHHGAPHKRITVRLPHSNEAKVSHWLACQGSNMTAMCQSG